jgi:hypothetical protein
MYNKITEIIDTLRGIEERACRIGFNPDDAKQHIRLIRELKAECDVNNLDCKAMIETLPLAKLDITSLLLIS